MFVSGPLDPKNTSVSYKPSDSTPALKELTPSDSLAVTTTDAPAYQVTLSTFAEQEQKRNSFVEKFRSAVGALSPSSISHFNAKPLQAGEYDASFIEEFSLTYRKLRTDTLAGKTPQDVQQLDDAYVQAVSEASNSLSHTLAPFSPDSVEAIRSHLLNLSSKSLEIVLQAPADMTDAALRQQIQSGLQFVQSTYDHTPVKMNYADVKTLSGMLKSLPNLPMSVGVTDKETTHDAAVLMGQWYSALRTAEKTLSPDVAVAAHKQVMAKISSFHSHKAQQLNQRNYGESIDKLTTQLKKLQKLYKSLAEQIKTLMQNPNKDMERISILTKQQDGYNVQIAGILSQIEEINKQHRELQNNPSAIVTTEEYQDIDVDFKSIQAAVDHK